MLVFLGGAIWHVAGASIVAHRTGRDERALQKLVLPEKSLAELERPSSPSDSQHPETAVDRDATSDHSGKKPVDMTDVELQAAGYQWESSSKHEGSLLGGGIALVPGALFHPTGHYFVGNAEAGWKLLKLQG